MENITNVIQVEICILNCFLTSQYIQKWIMNSRAQTSPKWKGGWLKFYNFAAFYTFVLNA